MRRLSIAPRPNWQHAVENQGLTFHAINGEKYLDESACYKFPSTEIDEIDEATREVNDMTLAVVDKVIREDLFTKFGIPRCIVPIINSWDFDSPTIYGRYDFTWRPGVVPKLLEYDADTPTTLLEAAVIQWYWLQDEMANTDQLNSIREKLLACFERWPIECETLYFSSVKDHDEDFGTVNYMRDTAISAGLPTEFIYLEDIGWDNNRKIFVDVKGRPIHSLFKLYPWEWLHQRVVRIPRLRFGYAVLRATVENDSR